jgi:hypothetical protein
LAEAQRAFYGECLRAEQALEQGAAAEGPGGESAGGWLRDLRERNRELARQEGFEKVRAEAERSARAGDSPPDPAEGPSPLVSPRGLPLSWRAGPDDPPPSLDLVSARRRQERASALGTAGWLGLLAGGWLASCSARLRRGARRLWPEVFAGAGALGWSLAGPTPVAVFLLALGAFGRLLLLAAGLRRLLARPKPGAAPGGSRS